MAHIAVLGEGAWGTAIAQTLAANGHHVLLWCHEQGTCRDIKATRTNSKFLPDVTLHKNIEPITDSAHLASAHFIAEAIPVPFLRSVLNNIRNHVRPDQRWIVLSKGIEHTTGMFPSQVIDDVLGYHARTVVVSGPSFAKDLAAQRFTAFTIAGASEDAVAVQHLFTNAFVVGVLSEDLIGAQVGGALKNVLALGAGIVNGAGFGDNARALFITHGLHEMMYAAHRLGGKRETILGLAGFGDVILSATSAGRNYSFGMLLGQGMKLAELSQKFEVLPESINTVQSVHQLAQQRKVALPLCEALYRVVMGQAPVQNLMQILARPLV